MKKIISILLLMSLLLTSFAFAESATSQLQEMYAQAELLMATGDYAGAATKFEAMGAYSDASQMAMYCKAVAAAETLGMYDVAIEAFKNLGDFKDSKQMATYYDGRKNQAAADYIIGEDITAVSDGDLETAEYGYKLAADTFAGLALFKDCLGRMSDCQTKGKAIDAEQNTREAVRRENRYQEALALEQEGKYEEAIKIYEELGNYKDCPARIIACNDIIKEQEQQKELALKEQRYQNALGLEQEGKYKEASVILEELADYKDSLQHLKNCYSAIAADMRLIKQSSKMYDKGKMYDTSTTSYVYKDHSNGSYTVEIIHMPEVNDIQDKTVIEVDEYGKYISGAQKGAWTKIQGNKWQNSNDTYTTQIEYDEHNYSIKEVKTYKSVGDSTNKSMNGKVETTIIENEYDDYGNIISRSFYVDGEYARTWEYKNTYDEENRVIETLRTIKYANGRSLQTRIEYKYNKYGLKIEEKYDSTDSTNHSQVVSFEYESK